MTTTLSTDENLMTKEQAAELLGVPIRTLQHWRYTGKLMAHTRVPPINVKSSRVLYLESDVREFGVKTGRLRA